MPYEFLADPNEAEEAADFHVKQFLDEGFKAGAILHLIVIVAGIPFEKMAAVESRFLELFDCSFVERGKSGLFVKKGKIVGHLKPMEFQRDNLVKAAHALYRLILDEDVSVEIKSAPR